MKQRKLFTVVLTDEIKRGLHLLARERGIAYGVFFSTSGKALTEQVNPNAQYDYIFRTDRDVS